ncbi:hypothetical protein ACQP2Y_11600 [Actinoplanes sp. CA-051413]|uniref:hypothetical protein n=1 Tax=Actinoplanes sp. CA-051413 TaxID=3239899 RepID=UPI003D96A93B
MSDDNVPAEVDVFISLTRDEIRALPREARDALERLIVELRAAGSVARPLTAIATEITDIAGSVTDVPTDVLPAGVELRAMLMRSAEELRLHDSFCAGPYPDSSGSGTCTRIMISQPPVERSTPSPYVIIGRELIRLPRPASADDPTRP